MQAATQSEELYPERALFEKQGPSPNLDVTKFVPTRLKIWGIIAGLHILVTAFGATMIQLPRDNVLIRALYFYGRLSGAAQGFNYFAPEIGSELRAHFQIIKADGTSLDDTFGGTASREAQLRFNNVVGEIAQAIDSEKDRKALAAAWAAKMFNRYPDAKKVNVIIESYKLPSMEGYREGHSTGWLLFYKGIFVR
jgi:hypothetical protein